MADTLTHVTLACAAAQDERIPQEARAVLARYRDAYRLGAVAFDLPYYDALWKNAARRAAGLPVAYNDVGQRLHAVRGPVAVRHLLDTANVESAWALAAGAATHFAIDRIFHSRIERAATTDPLGRTHEQLENDAGIEVHCDLLGHTGIGTRYALDALIFPAERSAHRHIATAFAACGIPVAAVQVARWIRGLRRFAALHCGPFPWVRTRTQGDIRWGRIALDMADEALDALPAIVGAAWTAPASVGSLLGDVRMADGA